MSGPTGDRMIRVDMTNQTAEIAPYPDDWKLLGGRALSARILLDECDPTCDPLGPDNVLVMAPGVVSGTAAPTSGRISMGGKSPLTHGIKEANRSKLVMWLAATVILGISFIILQAVEYHEPEGIATETCRVTAIHGRFWTEGP